MYNDWPHAGWWARKESLARKMSLEELWYARRDCFETAKANPETEPKYFDELSVYAQEMRIRKLMKGTE